MKSLKIAITIILAAIVSACATKPTEGLGDSQAENANRLSSGPANAATKDVDVVPTTAGSYMGDAESKNTNAESAVTATNSQSGTVQTGWQFAGVSDVNAAVASRIESDPVLKVLQGQAERLSQVVPPDEAAVTDVANRMAARMKEIETSIAKAGGDVSGLKDLHQVFVNISLNGAKGEVSKEHAQAMADAIPDAIRASNGK